MTSLTLDSHHVIPWGIPHHVEPLSLKLPNLRELSIPHLNYPSLMDMLIKDNAEQLENLNLYDSNSGSLYEGLTLMPKLKTLSLERIYDTNKTSILRASTSLETFVCLTRYYDQGIKLPKLAKFITKFSHWSIEMLELNSETLEVIALEVNSYENLLDLLGIEFPKLRNITVCDRHCKLSKADAMDKLRAKYPLAKIQFEARGIGQYTRDYLISK